MKLNDNDYQNIADLIEVGEHNIEYEKDGEMLTIDYEYDTEGYVEDDAHCGYGNGTGAWVETGRYLFIHSAEAYDEDGNGTPCEVDCARLERLVA